MDPNEKANADEATADFQRVEASQGTGDRTRIRYVGDYELLDEIAHGAMGVVYRARQVSLNRMVALKMILSGGRASEKERLRFQSEAEAVASLDHPNIIPIYEVGEHEGQLYFSMRLLEHGSLAASLSRGEWPTDDPSTMTRAAKIVASLAKAMHFAHQRGILHRDLKPGNVLLDRDNEAVISDFGLAKRTDTESTLTEAGFAIGTPSYMAPEQAKGSKSLTTSVDVYALGAILYSLIAGSPPFSGDNAREIINDVIDKPARNLREVNPLVDIDLSVICHKCLEKNPEHRFVSAHELAEDLGRWKRGEAIQARPVSKLRRLAQWAARNPLLVTIGLMCFVFMSIVSSSLLLGYRSTQSALAMLKDREYALEIIAAAEANRSERPLDMATSLTRQIPIAGARDPRGWEWYYLNKKCSADFFTDASQSSIAWAGPYHKSIWSSRRNGVATLKNSGVNLWTEQSGLEGLLGRFAFENPNVQLGANGPCFDLQWSPDGDRLSCFYGKGRFVDGSMVVLGQWTSHLGRCTVKAIMDP